MSLLRSFSVYRSLLNDRFSQHSFCFSQSVSWDRKNRVIPKCFHSIQRIQWQKTYLKKKDCSIWTSYLLCKKPADYLSARKTQVTKRIFKLTSFHVSMKLQIPWICWIQWISAVFGEDSVAITLMLAGNTCKNLLRQHKLSMSTSNQYKEVIRRGKR